MVGNKIITISGQPVSGKSSVVKEMIKMFKEQGLSEENIHVISTGHEFRNYFNAISELIKNYDNENYVKDLSDNPYLKRLFEKKEYRKVLTDAILKLKTAKCNIEDINIEKANNLKELEELRNVVDTLIDTDIEQKGKEINLTSRPDEVWIVDSRLAFYNIPEAFSVRLTTNSNVAAERLFNDKNRGKEDRNYESIEDAKKARENRMIAEQERFKTTYGTNLEDENNYNLVIDTSYSKIEDISEAILNCLDCYVKEEPFAKRWASPKIFLPLQQEKETTGKGLYFTAEELVEIIKRDGYHPNAAIEIVEVDGYKYIIEGHHRNFCAANIGKTLIPYKVLAKDDEHIYDSGNTARTMASGLKRQNLIGHEWLIGDDFTYDEVYPGIHQKLIEKENKTR